MSHAQSLVDNGRIIEFDGSRTALSKYQKFFVSKSINLIEVKEIYEFSSVLTLNETQKCFNSHPSALLRIKELNYRVQRFAFNEKIAK